MKRNLVDNDESNMNPTEIASASSTPISRKKLLICGILLMYGVVSTSLITWYPQPLRSSNVEPIIISSSEAVYPDFSERRKHLQLATANADPSSSSPSSSSSSSSSSSRATPHFSIFYNVYIPMDQGEKGKIRALRIVQEQMHQIGQSYATSFDQPVRLYYNTIGMPGILTAADMQSNLCIPNHIDCVHLQHYQQAFEEFTLQRLHDYCHAVPHDDDSNKEDSSDPQNHQNKQPHRVVYLHNKGSYHDWQNGENTRWRRHLTAAVTTRECLEPIDRSCSVCGLVFYGAWALLFPGNVWTADCAYVRRLPSPPTFFAAMDDVFTQRQNKMRENPRFAMAFPDVDGIDSHGAGRYAQEHWIGSHPSLNPCDLTADPLDDWRHQERSPSEFSWSMFPRPAQLNDPSTDYDQPPLIAGNLFKWFTLYHRAPADDSWVWKWFPYGERYRKAVKLYGNRTFDVMVTQEIERFRTMHAGPPSETNTIAVAGVVN